MAPELGDEKETIEDVRRDLAIERECFRELKIELEATRDDNARLLDKIKDKDDIIASMHKKIESDNKTLFRVMKEDHELIERLREELANALGSAIGGINPADYLGNFILPPSNNPINSGNGNPSIHPPTYGATYGNYVSLPQKAPYLYGMPPNQGVPPYMAYRGPITVGIDEGIDPGDEDPDDDPIPPPEKAKGKFDGWLDPSKIQVPLEDLVDPSSISQISVVKPANSLLITRDALAKMLLDDMAAKQNDIGNAIVACAKAKIAAAESLDPIREVFLDGCSPEAEQSQDVAQGVPEATEGDKSQPTAN